MAAPEISSIYPNDSSTGIPVGADVSITFTNGIDILNAKANVVIYGPDFDRTSGPDSALWIDNLGNNPYYLTSPSLTGLVSCTYSLVYVDGNGDEISPEVLTLSDEETGDGTDAYRHKLVVTPSQPFAPDADYKVYVIGNAESGTSRGISSRTVFDVDATGATSTDAGVVVYGGYTASGDDVVNIQITTAGDIGTAKYKWWYDSEGESEATTGRLTSRRYRRLEDGVQIRFTGSDFQEDDVYTVAVYGADYLATSYTFDFSTGSGSITEVPATAATSIIGTESALTSTATNLTVLSMTPDDGAIHQSSKNARDITIKFSGSLDSDTVTDSTVTVLGYPISGHFSTSNSTNANEAEELYKKLTVSGDTLTIEL